MDQKMITGVLKNPEFQKMARKKSRLGWCLSAIMFTIYVVYILFIGVSPESFAEPVSPGSVTSWGIYIGMFVIFFAFAITGFYVYKANGEFDKETQDVIDNVIKGDNNE